MQRDITLAVSHIPDQPVAVAAYVTQPTALPSKVITRMPMIRNPISPLAMSSVASVSSEPSSTAQQPAGSSSRTVRKTTGGKQPRKLLTVPSQPQSDESDSSDEPMAEVRVSREPSPTVQQPAESSSRAALLMPYGRKTTGGKQPRKLLPALIQPQVAAGWKPVDGRVLAGRRCNCPTAGAGSTRPCNGENVEAVDLPWRWPTASTNTNRC